MTKKKTDKGSHGGRREGSGKPSFFRKRYARTGGHTAPLRMSKGTYDALDALRDALTAKLEGRQGEGFPREVSRPTFVEALVLKFGKSLTVDDIFRLDT